MSETPAAASAPDAAFSARDRWCWIERARAAARRAAEQLPSEPPEPLADAPPAEPPGAAEFALR